MMTSRQLAELRMEIARELGDRHQVLVETLKLANKFAPLIEDKCPRCLMPVTWEKTNG